MAQRDLDFSPSVTDVTATNPQNGALTVGAEVMDKIAEASAQSKALAATAQTSLAFRQLDQKYRMDAASNPNDPEALSNLQQARTEAVSAIGANVPSIAMRDYQAKTMELGKASDASNELWGTKQLVRNASANIQVAYHTNLQQAAMDGQQFAASGAPSSEIEGALHYAQLRQQMQQFAAPVIGSERTDLYLKNFQQDYTKTFVASVAENNPRLAAALLDQDAIKQHFTTQDVGDMADLIKRTQRQQDLIQSLQTVKSTTDVTGLINDDQKTYLEKRATIDQLEMQGSISSKNAANARRVIRSSEDLETQTDTPVMAETINHIYDLNQNTSLKPTEYLSGVKAVQDMVMQQQASGQITGADATKLQKEITTLTQKRMADDTKSVGYKFGAANKKFNALPPEYRGEATRQLFYASQGQDLTPQQLSSHADQIIDTINTKRRTDALGIVARTTNDDAFLQATGYTRADVAATAKNRGLSQDQVIQALRSKYAKKRAGPGLLKKVAPDDAGETNGSDGIRINEPAPPDTQSMDDGEE